MGIDQDHESRSVPTVGSSPASLAHDLCRDGWKFALVYQDGEPVAGVEFESSARQRVYWAVPSPRKKAP